MSAAEESAPRVVIALCGLGSAGQIHFKGIRFNQRCRLKYIIDRETVKAPKILSAHGMPEVRVLSIKQLHVALEDPELQAIIIATPTFTHEEIVIKSLRAGKAVFCEKPLAETIEKIASCYDEAEKAGRPLFCAFQRRFDPGLARIRGLIAGGQIVKVHVIKTTSRDCNIGDSWMKYLSTSGGIFHDTGVHDLDEVCWLLNEEPESVCATVHCHSDTIRGFGDVDTIAIVMKFPSGAISISDISRHSCFGYDQRAEVHGSGGMLQCNNPPVDSVVEQRGLDAVHVTPTYRSYDQRYAAAYQLELDHFLDVVTDPLKQLRVSRRDTLCATQLASACEVSSKNGQTIAFKYNDYK